MRKIKTLAQRLILTGVFGLSGCSGLDVQFGGSPKEINMVGTPYAESIRIKADSLNKSENCMNWRKAAKLYQSVGDIKKEMKVSIDILRETGDLWIYKEFGLDNKPKL